MRLVQQLMKYNTSCSAKNKKMKDLHQFLIVKCSTLNNLPSPNNHGWKTENDMLQPVLMTKDPASHALPEQSFCHCKKSACWRANCSFKVNNLGCTEGRLCSNSDSCENSWSTFYASDNESDENLWNVNGLQKTQNITNSGDALFLSILLLLMYEIKSVLK